MAKVALANDPSAPRTERSEWKDISSSRSDRHQARQNARDHAKTGGLFVEKSLDANPREGPCGRSELCHGQGLTGLQTTFHRTPALKPNQPTQRRPAPIMVITKLLGCIATRG